MTGEPRKPLVEPTSALMSPLYDQLERAQHLINCAYYATYHDDVGDCVGDPIRTTLDVALKEIGRVYAAMHDMIVWVRVD